MTELRETVIKLAERIATNPEERELLCEALRVKITEMRRRGEQVPDEILKLEQALEGDDCDGDLWDNLPI